ncbi:MAG: hypothetical protein ACTSUE_03875 [Promethearchaeota archaeon]
MSSTSLFDLLSIVTLPPLFFYLGYKCDGEIPYTKSLKYRRFKQAVLSKSPTIEYQRITKEKPGETSIIQVVDGVIVGGHVKRTFGY